jgi:hypothetical protein
MRNFPLSFFRRLIQWEQGQSMAFVALQLAVFTGLAGVSVEAGHGYVAYRQLQASTNAAVLAGAQAMPNVTTASSNVTTFSSKSGNLNASNLLTNVAVTPTYSCLSNVATTLSVACQPASDGNNYNSIKVVQTADVPSWFAGMFGIKTFHLSYTATALMRGGTVTPWNIAIILDGTGSMNSSDGGTQCTGTRESCALKGVQALLSDLNPCALGQTCSSSTSYVDSVALYVFPPPSTATAPYDYCSGGTPSNVSNGNYTVPNLTSSYSYQVIGFSNDYKSSDSSSTLATSSNASKAAGVSGTSCSGIYPKGGAGTYFAQIIYQAQSDLAARKTAVPTSRNAMIILSDGDASACATGANTGAGGCNSASNMSASSGYTLNGLGSSTSTTYPSALGECGQAVLAAQAATQAGTKVFTIGYGSPISGSCSTDQKYTSSGNIAYGGGAWPATSTSSDNGRQACNALAAMASTTGNFYSDGAGSCSAIAPSNAAITQLTTIFNSIANNLTAPRLIPNGTT